MPGSDRSNASTMNPMSVEKAPQPAADRLQLIRRLLTSCLAVLFIVSWLLFLIGVADGERQCAQGSGFPSSLAMPSASTPATAPATAGPIIVDPFAPDASGTTTTITVPQGRKMLAARQLLAASQSEYCRREYSFAWWIVWLQLICVVVGIVSALHAGLRQRFADTVRALFVIVTVLLMYIASTFNMRILQLQDSGDNAQMRSNQTALAGTVLLLLLNLVYICVTSDKLGAFAPEYNHPAFAWNQPKELQQVMVSDVKGSVSDDGYSTSPTAPAPSIASSSRRSSDTTHSKKSKFNDAGSASSRSHASSTVSSTSVPRPTPYAPNSTQ